MTPEQATKARYNPFDLTKIWSHKEYPLIPVGKMVLNRNPVNYFAEVEQIAFNPAHMVPGIEPSPDRMLQGCFEFHLSINPKFLVFKDVYSHTETRTVTV